MAHEWLEADVEGLYRLAVVIDRFWRKPSLHLLMVIGQQEQKYGLSPLDRRRLEWVIERAGEEKKRGPRPAKVGEDPRKYLMIL